MSPVYVRRSLSSTTVAEFISILAEPDHCCVIRNTVVRINMYIGGGLLYFHAFKFGVPVTTFGLPYSLQKRTQTHPPTHIEALTEKHTSHSTFPIMNTALLPTAPRLLCIHWNIIRTLMIIPQRTARRPSTTGINWQFIK